MQVEFLVNGGVSLLLSPENEMEEQLLKQLMKQQIDLTEIRSAVQVLNKTFRSGVLISKKALNKKETEDIKDTQADTPSVEDDNSETEKV